MPTRHQLTKVTVDEQTGEILIVGKVQPTRQWTGEGLWIKLYKMRLFEAVKQRDLTPYQFYILGLLICDMKAGNLAWLYPSDIIRTLNFGRNTVYTALKVLEEKGYIRKERNGVYLVSDRVAWIGRRKEVYDGQIREG